MKNVLQTLYLRVDSTSQSLTKRALAQLILKIVYSLNKPSTLSEIKNELNGILGTTISNKKIDEAIKLLLTEYKISFIDGKYSISAEKKKKIETAATEFSNRQTRIIDKFFFGLSSQKHNIENWFEEVTIEYFEEYSSEWVADLYIPSSKGKQKHKAIQTILDLVTEHHPNIQSGDKETLKRKYLEFLRSSDSDVSHLLWDYGTSRFSSSLIIANTSADPITIEEFSNSMCIIDTNVLMYIDLEKGEFKESFESLGKIFTKLNIKPVYFSITRDEFTRAMERKKNDVIRVIENYDIGVIRQADDPFIKTALHRGCTEQEDFAQFFNQLMDVPDYFSDSLKLERYENAELQTVIEKGERNEELREKINEIHRKKWIKDKSPGPLLHDAGLISGAEYVRKSDKCFILSRDRSINAVALQNPLNNQMPIAIGLHTLINLLAIDNGGTDIDPTDCAPLFASIIKLALIPEHDVFKIEDLSRMLDIEMQIGSLSNDQVVEIAKEVHHGTVTGLPDGEISLSLNRRFQAAKIEFQSDLERANLETFKERTEKERHVAMSTKAIEALRKKYIGECRDKYDAELKNNRLLAFVVFPILLSAIIFLFIYFEFETEKKWVAETVALSIHIVAWFILDFFFLAKRFRSKYSERIQGIDALVKKKINDELEENQV